MARRYVIYGAGGIGGASGARLHDAGRDVVLIARGPHLEAIRARGLTLKSPAGTLELQVPTAAHPRELDFGRDDVVFLTMKTQDSADALDERRLAGGASLAVVCAQNGIENERMALRRFERVYAMEVLIATSCVEPGLILNYDRHGGGTLVLGRHPEGADDLARAIAADLTAAGFRGEVEERIQRWKYHKLIRNLGAAFPAVFGPGADTAELLVRIEAEAVDARGRDHEPRGPGPVQPRRLPHTGRRPHQARRRRVRRLRPRARRARLRGGAGAHRGAECRPRRGRRRRPDPPPP